MYYEWKKGKKICLRQNYKGGDKMFVDYAGQTIPITNADTREVIQAQIFVAVLGASNYTYSEASLNQQIESWLGSHVRIFNYFGGVAALIIPDNLLCVAPHKRLSRITCFFIKRCQLRIIFFSKQLLKAVVIGLISKIIFLLNIFFLYTF
jgi:transposase